MKPRNYLGEFSFTGMWESRKLMCRESALHKKSELSAEGAEYESQGQAPNNVRRVAPGKIAQMIVKL